MQKQETFGHFFLFKLQFTIFPSSCFNLLHSWWNGHSHLSSKNCWALWMQLWQRIYKQRVNRRIPSFNPLASNVGWCSRQMPVHEPAVQDMSCRWSCPLLGPWTPTPMAINCSFNEAGMRTSMVTITVVSWAPQSETFWQVWWPQHETTTLKSTTPRVFSNANGSDELVEMNQQKQQNSVLPMDSITWCSS